VVVFHQRQSPQSKFVITVDAGGRSAASAID